MRTKILFTLLVLTLSTSLIYAQDDIQIGSQNETRPAASGALYDYSVQNVINIKVQLWGFIRFPGFYIVPAGTSLNELISLAGGPTEDSKLDDIRVVKLKEGTQTSMIKYDYNDLVWEDNIKAKISYVRLDAGDIVIIPGEPRYFAREDIAFYLGLLTALASLAALVISIIIITE
ncbi:MAG TPA: SLBB domain-containing protein [Ignavibacteriaceae bacterium]|nr:SLBB domain-containing protein [Ignavibacteriaceae bacterium]